MLKVAVTNDPTQNAIAPSVYIDGVEKENGTYTVHYSLIDTNNSWMTDNSILDSLSVYISDGISTEKRLLKTIVTANVIKNNTVKDYAIFNNTSSNITVTGWTGNPNISSSIVSENILVNNTLTKIVNNGTIYQYINKVKDLDILNFNISFTTTGSSSTGPIDGQLLVGYRPDKVASLGFIFDLERFLEANSPVYNIVKNNQTYKDQILSGSYVDTVVSYFSKRNITNQNKYYEKIKSTISASLIDSTKSKYYIGIADDNKDLANRSYYDISAHLKINDYSKQFASLKIRDAIRNALNFLENYKNDFLAHINDKTIQDINSYIFENTYEPRIGDIKKLVDDLTPLCSLFSGRPTADFASLFVSLLHPLTTRVELIDRLINFVRFLDSSTTNIITSLATTDTTRAALKDGYLVFDKEFTKSGTNPYSADFNYDYDEKHGIEALSADPLSTRLAEVPSYIKEISSPEWETRKLLEARKYYITPSSNTISNVNHLSISNIDFNSESYQLLISLPQSNTDIYNNLYLRLKEYNDFSFNYRKPETYYFQLLYSGINVKTVSNRNNNSTNNLLKNTLFDSNADTSAASLKFMEDTNIKSLYFHLDDTQFIDITTVSSSVSSSTQANAAVSSGTGDTPVYTFSTSSLTSPDLKAKSFIYYNTVYGVNPVEGGSGDSLDIYTFSEDCVNSLFTKKLRLFNSVFAVRKKITARPTAVAASFDVTNDLNLNILPIYLNRTTKDAKINVSVEDI